MTTNFSDLQTINDAFDQPYPISLPVIPFEFFTGEFIATGFPNDVWEIDHRDSHRTAILSRAPFIFTVGQQWLVAHSLCSGVATFSTLHDAENYIATLFRLAARNDCYCGGCKPKFERMATGRDVGS